MKVAAAGIIAALLAATVKSLRPELGMPVTLCAGTLLLLYAVLMFSGITDDILSATAAYGLNGHYIGTIVRITALAYITQFASDICRDAGEGTIASRVELCGRLIIVGAALPAVADILEIVSGLLQIRT